MTQPTDHELIQSVDRFFKRQRLLRKKNEIEQRLAETKQVVDELAHKAQLELDDVEILKQDGLPKLFFKLIGKLETKITKEQKELDAAMAKLESIRSSFSILHNSLEKIQSELDDFSDASNNLELLSLQTSNKNSDETTILANKVAEAYQLIKETEEKIAFGEQAEEELKQAQREIRSATTPGPLARANSDLKLKNSIKLVSMAVEHLDYFKIDFKTDAEELNAQLRQIKKRGITPNANVLAGIAIAGSVISSVAASGVGLYMHGNSEKGSGEVANNSRRTIEDLRRRILKEIKQLKKEHSRQVTSFASLEKQWDKK